MKLKEIIIFSGIICFGILEVFALISWKFSEVVYSPWLKQMDSCAESLRSQHESSWMTPLMKIFGLSSEYTLEASEVECQYPSILPGTQLSLAPLMKTLKAKEIKPLESSTFVRTNLGVTMVWMLLLWLVRGSLVTDNLSEKLQQEIALNEDYKRRLIHCQEDMRQRAEAMKQEAIERDELERGHSEAISSLRKRLAIAEAAETRELSRREELEEMLETKQQELLSTWDELKMKAEELDMATRKREKTQEDFQERLESEKRKKTRRKHQRRIIEKLRNDVEALNRAFTKVEMRLIAKAKELALEIAVKRQLEKQLHRAEKELDFKENLICSLKEEANIVSEYLEKELLAVEAKLIRTKTNLKLEEARRSRTAEELHEVKQQLEDLRQKL